MQDLRAKKIIEKYKSSSAKASGDKPSAYKPSEIESKWQAIWEKEKIYSPNLDTAKNPFYNLMMFPYPSAEGMHVGNMYAFTGADVYGRFQRMQGKDVFEPIGLDGFGIHSENYALRIGTHPVEQAKISEKNFYRQLKSIGNSFDWTRTVETYKPEYYKWTQWLFIQLFKAGLAYRKKAPVNFCPSCKTVLADEQVEDGLCERCKSPSEKKDLEQWFFKITKYADRLLSNLTQIDWSERVKTAQRRWIGRSDGAIINFEFNKKTNYILLHGFTGSPDANFFPWLKRELKGKKHETYAPQLPNTNDPDIEEQAEFVLKNTNIDENTVLFGHSLGSVVALKIAEKLKKPIKKLILAAGFAQPKFLDKSRPFESKFRWNFDFRKIKRNVGEVILLRAKNDTAVPQERSDYIKGKIGGTIVDFVAEDDHICGTKEPIVLKNLIESIDVFTTRPETIDGATFLVLSPQHPKVNTFKSKEVINYVAASSKKNNQDRQKEKTGVFSGEYVINSVTKKKIPVWIADYVLMDYGTGAIMAVPAEDQRDREFAQKYNIPIDKTTLTAKPEGKKITNYHLRDWLISRQRYWGPPIPMIYCEIDGWQPVPEKDLPVDLPFIEDYKPLGTGRSPLENHPEFYKTTCPNCGGRAKRETDVSDTFLDSSWYFLRYVSTDIDALAFDTKRVKKWLPVNMYIGGAEHSVLHLLYSRFISMALKDLGFISFEEPFAKFRAHGLIIKDGAKMSKSKGNVVIPDEYVRKFGADTLRAYLMFMGPFSQGGDFRDTGIEGMHRFLKRVWTLFAKTNNSELRTENGNENLIMMHKTIKKITEDIEKLGYNTAIAALMEWYNFLSQQKFVSKQEAAVFLKLIAPFAPHLSEELYQLLTNKNEYYSIHVSNWPAYDSNYLVKEEAVIAVQVNGKLRGSIRVDVKTAKDRAKVEELVKHEKNVKNHLSGKDIKKVIYVEGKVLNFVVL